MGSCTMMEIGLPGFDVEASRMSRPRVLDHAHLATLKPTRLGRAHLIVRFSKQERGRQCGTKTHTGSPHTEPPTHRIYQARSCPSPYTLRPAICLGSRGDEPSPAADQRIRMQCRGLCLPESHPAPRLESRGQQGVPCFGRRTRRSIVPQI